MMFHRVHRVPAGIRVFMLFVGSAFPIAFLVCAYPGSACQTDAPPSDVGSSPLYIAAADEAADKLPEVLYEGSESPRKIGIGSKTHEAAVDTCTLACMCEPTGTTSYTTAC